MKTHPFDIHKAAGIIIKDKKLLVEKSENKEFYIAPGGSIEENETPEDALVRELMEEFQITVDKKDLEFFGTFHAEAATQPGKHILMEAFVVRKWQGRPTPDHEVEDIQWITSKIPQDMKVGSIFEHQIIPLLKKKVMID